MTKGLYIANINLDRAEGYEKKILGQIKGFLSNGIDMDLVCRSDTDIVRCEGGRISSSNRKPLRRIARSASARVEMLLAALPLAADRRCKAVYLRYARSDPGYLLFLLILRAARPRLRIVSEIPTYPYDIEAGSVQSLGEFVWRLLDRSMRHFTKLLLDAFSVVSFHGKVFGRQTFSIENGVDVDAYRLRSPRSSSGENLEIVAVANIKPWHGYDRAIDGIAAAASKGMDPQIRLHIVSPKNDEVKSLMARAKEAGLGAIVIFHGPLYGQALDELIDQCDVALGSLSPHRQGLGRLSILKVREYLARGIPIVNAYDDPLRRFAPEGFLTVPSDEEPIDMIAVRDWALALREDKDLPRRMREVARARADWGPILKPVAEFFLGAST